MGEVRDKAYEQFLDVNDALPDEVRFAFARAKEDDVDMTEPTYSNLGLKLHPAPDFKRLEDKVDGALDALRPHGAVSASDLKRLEDKVDRALEALAALKASPQFFPGPREQYAPWWVPARIWPQVGACWPAPGSTYCATATGGPRHHAPDVGELGGPPRYLHVPERRPRGPGPGVACHTGTPEAGPQRGRAPGPADAPV